jgi:D-alanine transaminase
MAKSVVMHRINVYQNETKIGENSMIDYAFYNGVFTPYDACCVPISDRAIFFGEAVYDVMLGRGGRPYQQEEHIGRLLGNAEKIGLTDIPSKEHLGECIEELLAEAQAEDFVLYAQLSANEGRRSHTRTDTSVNVLMTVTKTKIPDELLFTDAITLPDMRHGYCNVKTTALLPAVMSLTEAEEFGAEVAIFEKDGYITECSHANISIIIGNTLLTHPRDNSVLPGISENNLIRICSDRGLSHKARAFTIEEAKKADLVLITSTTKLVRVCRSIGGKALRLGNIELAKQIFSDMRQDLIDKT